ncbi:MAG: hypothetical protein JKY56_20250 [Kofleriaceae bacterium]|nr:hypothetical protein [Kofleriaceae bacterium]
MKKTTSISMLALVVFMSGCTTLQPVEQPGQDNISGEAKPTVIMPVEIKQPGYTSVITEQNTVKTDRYTKVSLKPLPEQLDLLSINISTNIPRSISTVKEAVEFLLMRSGYVLLDLSQQNEETKIMMANPLPEAHRHIQTMPLRAALSMLAGNAFELKQNNVFRTIMYVKN